MKTIKQITLLALILCSSAVTLAQKIQLLDTKVTVIDLLKAIESQSTTHFVYSEDEVNTRTSILLNQKSYELSELLNEIQSKTNLQFKKVDGYYVITSTTAQGADKTLYQQIRGKVIDVETGGTLPSTNIYQQGNINNSTVTDLDGNFVLDVPLGRINLVVSFIGYQMQIIPLLIKSGEEQYLPVNLASSISKLNEVVVEAEKDKARTQNELAYASGRSFTIQEANRYAGTLGDPARMARSYAGVVPTRDDRNDIIIRGNSPTGIQWKLDDIEIPNPNHYGGIGLTGNTTTLLNMNLLGNSDFLMGAFPSEYGNALAGVFDLKTKSINPKKRQHRFQTGWNGFELGTEGPFTKKKDVGTYSLTYRYSFLDVMQHLGLDLGVLPEFQDITGQFNFKVSDKTTVSLLGIWAKSHIELDDRDFDEVDTTGPGEFIRTGSNLALAGVNLKHRFNKKWSLKSNVSVLENRIETEIDTFNFVSDAANRVFTDNSGETKYSVFLQFDRRVRKNHLRIGTRWDTYVVDFNSISIDPFGQPKTTHKENSNINLTRLYVENEHRLTDRFRFRAGVHSQYLLLNDAFAIEPRLAIRYLYKDNNAFAVSYGQHHQMQPRNVYFVETITANGSELTNKDLGFSGAHHFTFAYDKSINQNLRFKAESYYQHLFDIPVKANGGSFSMVNTGAAFFIPQEDSLVNEGTGRNYGVELTLEKFLSKGYYFMVNTALFKSEYQTLERKWRSTAFDMQYTVNGLAGYEKWFGQRVAVGADLKLTYAGGKPFEPVDETTSIAAGEVIFDETRAFEPRLPGYFRTDLKIFYRINYKKFYTEFAMDLQNLTNQKNVFQQEFNPRTGKYTTLYHMAFFPMFTFKALF